MAKVKTDTLLIFSNQFASMIRSQLPLVDVLDNLAQETPQRELRYAIEDITQDVRSGVDFADALAMHDDIFDRVYINVVRAGMGAGRLAESLTQICEYLNKSDAVRRKVKSALSYPMFMLAAFIVVLNMMVFFILPRFQKMFESFHKELPAPTQWLMNFGDFYKSNWHIILLVVVSVAVAIMVWLSTREGRYLWDKYKLRVPILGSLWRMGSLSRFLRTFAVQLHNEVSLLDALKLAASSTDNTYLEDAILDIAEEVEFGTSITKAFQEYDIFSGIVLQMMSAGEESGTLDELLLSAADYFERLVNNRVDVVTGLINPIMTVVVGLAIAGMMVASFLPVFEMGGSVMGG